ncbi:DUF429 domain-containing protein, partial [bacterium]
MVGVIDVALKGLIGAGRGGVGVLEITDDSFFRGLSHNNAWDRSFTLWCSVLIEGFDVTSRPTKGKPATRCRAELDGNRLTILSVDDLPDVDSFLGALTAPGSRRMGIDSPLGMPRVFWDWLGLEDWKSGVETIGLWGRPEWVRRCGAYRGPNGERELFRPCDRQARACSPMKCFFIPVARMFHLVAPALAASEVSVLPHRPTEYGVEAIEAYPTLSVQTLTGNRSYKSDKNDTGPKRENRLLAVARLREEGIYGFRVEGLPEDI